MFWLRNKIFFFGTNSELKAWIRLKYFLGAHAFLLILSHGAYLLLFHYPFVDCNLQNKYFNLQMMSVFTVCRLSFQVPFNKK